MRERHRPIISFHFNQYHDVIVFYCALKMAPEEGRNVRNKLVTKTLAVIFIIKMLLLYCIFSTAMHLLKVNELFSFGGLKAELPSPAAE